MTDFRDALKPMRNYDLADWYFERIEKYVDEYIKDLRQDEFLRLDIVLQNGKSIFVENITYHNPNMLIVDGFCEGKRLRALIPHTSAQILLTVEKLTDKKEQKKIGFNTPDNESTTGE